VVLGPVSNAVSCEQLFVLGEGIGLRPGKSAQDAKLDTLGFTPLDTDGPRPDLRLRCADGRSLTLDSDSLDEDEIQTIKVSGQHEQEIAGAVAKDRGERACVSDRHADKLKKIDLKKTLVVGDQLDSFDSPKQRVGRYPEIARRLYGASVGVVTEPAE
jgi:hypothetical protein